MTKIRAHYLFLMQFQLHSVYIIRNDVECLLRTSIMNCLKFLVLRLFILCCTLYCRMRSTQMGRNCTVGGFPIIKRKKGASLIMGNGVMVLSHRWFNCLIVHRSSLNLVDKNAKLEFHDYSGASGALIVCGKHISIGKYTIIGAGTLIDDTKHHQFAKENGWRRVCKGVASPIIIGDYCYIGARSIILRGVTIGDYCIISAGSVITEDVPTGYLAKGNPAKLYPLPEHLRTRPDGTVVPLGKMKTEGISAVSPSPNAS